MKSAEKAKPKGKSIKKMPYLVGVDIGFGQTKWLSNHTINPQVIPSAILAGARVPENKLFDFDTVDLDHLVVTTEEGTYFAGAQALEVPSSGSKRTQIRDRASDPLSRVLFHNGIGLSLPHEDGKYDVFVVTGLPNTDYDRSIKENLEVFLNRPFSLTYHLSKDRTITKEINVIGVEIMRQPEGAVTYNQFAFDNDYFLTGSEHARQMVAVIDIGHFTTDFALFQKGVFVEDTTYSGSTVAVSEVYRLLEKKLILLFDEFGYSFEASDKDLDNIIRTGEVFYAGKTYDVSKQVEEASREVASIIAKKVLDQWGNETNRLELIILSGGGAYVFSEYLKEEFEKRRQQGFQVIEDPQFSNVLGFYMYGCIALAEKYGTEEVLSQYINHIFMGDDK